MASFGNPQKMQQSTSASTVCVTGATGFIASHLVKLLLGNGYTVNATVRDPDNKMKTLHLLKLQGAEDRLRLFKADLSSEGSFDDAVAGCDGVFHVASPVEADGDPTENMIEPAVKGTLNVLESCKKARTVKRVVITSSASTLSAKEKDNLIGNGETVTVDESCMSDMDYLLNKCPPPWGYYAAGKVMAERAAFEYGKEHGIEILSIIPSIVVGVPLQSQNADKRSMASSVELATSLLTGKEPFVQILLSAQMIFGTVSLVHVDDVCAAHVYVYENVACVGRHVCSGVSTSAPRLAEFLQSRFPAYYRGPALLDGVEWDPPVEFSCKKIKDAGFVFEHDGLDSVFDEDTVNSLVKIGHIGQSITSTKITIEQK